MHRDKGFTLIEILVALAVLVLTAGGVVVWRGKIAPTPTPTPTPKLESSPAPPLPEQPVPEGYRLLLSEVQKRGNLLVIVTLNITWQPERELPNEEAIKKQRDAITQAQNDLLNELAPFEVREYARWESVPSMGLVVDEGALKHLISSPKVKSIQEDKPEPLTK